MVKSDFVKKRARRGASCVGGMALVLCLGVTSASATTESVLFRFSGGAAGSMPYAGLIADAAGNLYGTTPKGGSGKGVIFELTPPTSNGGSWTETTLYKFTGGGDGSVPYAGLLFDSKGNLYGTTSAGGKKNGVVFELSPPANQGGAWSESALYKFGGGADGSAPRAGLIADKSGNLYGTTVKGGSNGNGVVFELSTPATPGGSWTETVLNKFTGGSGGGTPYSGLIADAAGNLYGTTTAGGVNDNGVVFELAPPTAPGGSWTETALHQFTGAADGSLPYAGLVADGAGNLYGTAIKGGTKGHGVVFKLAPPAPGGSWTQTVVETFLGGALGAVPYAGVILDNSGNLYGTTQKGGISGNGTVFKLAAPTTPGGKWTETVLYKFNGGSAGSAPYAGLLADKNGNLYGTTTKGGTVNNGIAYEVQP
jgi:uncharacterized repeat protein (TIGR03803 family)